ncbi:hypothetical protein [Streptomyces sp. NPDC004435]|uniref:hypothetical protein n=1 Tax=Streptomyces sp. NPDC004435 TaxID=3364701 RepID=UPI0036B8B083
MSGTGPFRGARRCALTALLALALLTAAGCADGTRPAPTTGSGAGDRSGSGAGTAPAPERYQPGGRIELVETSETGGPVAIAGGALWWPAPDHASFTGRPLSSLRGMTTIPTRAEDAAVPRVRVTAAARSVLQAFGSLWVAGAHEVLRHDPKALLDDPGAAPQARIRLNERIDEQWVFAEPMFAAFGSVWVLAPGPRPTGSPDRLSVRLVRIDPVRGTVLSDLPVGLRSDRPVALAAGPNMVYAVTAGAVTAVDPAQGKVVRVRRTEDFGKGAGVIDAGTLVYGALLLHVGERDATVLLTLDPMTLTVRTRAPSVYAGRTDFVLEQLVPHQDEAWAALTSGLVRIGLQGAGPPGHGSAVVDDLVPQDGLPWVCPSTPSADHLLLDGEVLWASGAEGIWAIRTDALPMLHAPAPAYTAKACPPEHH